MGNPFDEPSHVEAVDGEVVVDGPDGVAVSLTPDAAMATADRLADAAVEAHGQRLMKRDRPARGDEGR